MNRRISTKRLFLLLILVALLAACQTTVVPEPVKTPTYAAQDMASNTATQTPTSTSLATVLPTSSPTLEPTPTATATPLPTSRWQDQSIARTPLPSISEGISIDNLFQVRPVAIWGNGSVNKITLSPDGQILAVGTNIGAFLYNSMNFALVASLHPPHQVQSIAYSPDSHRIALGQSHGTIDIYDGIGYSQEHRLFLSHLDLPEIYKLNVNFSKDGAHLISVVETSEEVFINRWETTNWEAVGEFSTDSGSASYINSDINLIGIFKDNTLSLQSLTFLEDTSKRPLPTPVSRAIGDEMAFFDGEIRPSADGYFLLINDGTSLIHWQISEEEIIYRFDDYPDVSTSLCDDAPDTCLNTKGGFSWDCPEETIQTPIKTITMTPDNNKVLISLKENRTEFRRVSNGFLEWEIGVHFTELVFSADGAYFFGVRQDGTIEKRNSQDGCLINVLKQHPSQLTDLTFSPDGPFIAAGFNDGWIRVYSTLTGEFLGILEGSANALEFSPDGQFLAAGLSEGTVRIYDLAELDYFDLAPGHLDTVTDLTFSLDGQQILTGSADCTASIWTITPKNRTINVTPDIDNPFQITAVELSITLSTQYLSSPSKGIYLIEGNDLRDVILLTEAGISDMLLSPEGNTLAVTGESIWLIPAGTSATQSEPERLALNPDEYGYRLSFTPDGSILLIATDQSLAFWSVSDGKILYQIPTNTSTLYESIPAALEVSPDGSLIALGSQDGLIKIFAIPNQNLE